MPMTTLTERRGRHGQHPSILDRIDASGDCWLWTGLLHRKGYGVVKIESKALKVHNVIWTMLVGEIPEGMVLDHLCRVRHCVNPDHLEPVTPHENWKRGFAPSRQHARRTHCINGHPFSGDNLVIRVDGARGCRACRREASRKQRERA